MWLWVGMARLRTCAILALGSLAQTVFLSFECNTAQMPVWGQQEVTPLEDKFDTDKVLTLYLERPLRS
jgi:hypothetical protein